MIRTLVCLVGLMGVPLIGSPDTANAQQAWQEMHAGANSPTVEAARQQCIDQLVPVATCNRMAAMLDQGRCVVEPIPDGVKYHTLGGRGGTARNMMKALGGNTDAFVCRVQDYELHWYSSRISSLGERACNNFGVVASRPQPKFQAGQMQMILEAQAPQVITHGGIKVPLCCPHPGCEEEGHVHTYMTPLQQTIIPTNPTATFSGPGQRMN